MADVQMPQLGETVTEGTITRWFKEIGDQVAEDEVLFEVSTDKVDSEVPSPVAGYLAEIRAPEGETVDVGAVIAVVSDAPPADGAVPAAEVPAAETPSAETPSIEAAPAVAVPEDAAPAPAPGPPPVPDAAPRAGSGVVTSPLVRRLAEEHGIDIAAVTPSGDGGRVTRADVEKLIEQGGAPTAPAAPAAPATPVGPAPAPAATGPTRTRPKPAPVVRAATGDTVVPLNNMRRRTGEHMLRSKATSPHAVTIVEVDYENIERVRRSHKAAWRQEEGHSLTYLPFIARAVIDALRDFPALNATVGDGDLLLHNDVHLGIPVDLDFEGLLAPVVHSADGMRLRALARSFADVADRARSKQLSADDITGGTFTITNNGTFGPAIVIPIINQPQVAILSTDGISRKPVVVTTADGTEAIAIHSVGMLTLAWDHRAFDGAYSASFLGEVKDILETRDWEAEL